MAAPEIDPREYGRMEARVQHLEVAVRDMNEDVKAMRNILEQGKGGWKIIIAISTTVAALSSAVTWIVATFGSGVQR